MTRPQFGTPRFGAPKHRIPPPEPPPETTPDGSGVQRITEGRAARTPEPPPKPGLPLDRPSGMPAHPDTTEADRAWLEAQRAAADTARAAEGQPNSVGRILAARGQQLLMKQHPNSEEHPNGTTR